MHPVSLDDTQPNKPVQMPPQPAGYPHAKEDDDGSGGGPGCLAWGIVGIFSAGLALVVVMLAAFSGWSEGLDVARGYATATQDAYIFDQCNRTGNDIVMGNVGLVQRRLEDLLLQTPVPACLAQYIPTATQLYINNLPTVTPTASPTPTLTSTPEITLAPDVPEVTTEPQAVSNDSGYDLAGLLAEAQLAYDTSSFPIAIDTLEAIIAVDPNYEKGRVDNLLYQALMKQATFLYRNNGNLAEAILLTNRAEEYGDVGELNFERAVAQTYLESQVAKGINYGMAIRLLGQIVNNYGLPNYRGAQQQLIEQYIAYGDFLVQSSDNCGAVAQYDAALQLAVNDAVRVKRDTATQTCTFGQTPTFAGTGATPDPNATVNPNVPVPPTQPSLAPIGQPGG